MKRKRIILIGALLLAFVLSVGTYASSFNTATATLASTVGGAVIATANATPTQPDWQSLLPHSENGMEILRPDGPGDITSIQFQFPDSGAQIGRASCRGRV